MKRLIRIGKKLLFVLACLLTLIFIAYQFENLRGRSAWKSYKAQVESRGENLDPNAMIPPEVPDASNFAAIPFFTQYFNTNYKASRFGEVPEVRNEFKEFDEAVNEADNRNVILTNSFLPLKPVNLAELLAILRKSYVADPADEMREEKEAFQRRYGLNVDSSPSATKRPNVDTNMPPAQVARELLAEMQKYEPIIKQFQDAASRPFSRYPVSWDVAPAFIIPLPHLRVLKSPAVFLRIRAEAELAAGQPDKALDDIFLILRLADSLEGEPTLISFLVRIAVMTQAMDPLATGLRSGQWTDAQLAEIQNRLARINIVADQKQAVQAETVLCGLKTIDYIRTYPRQTVELFSDMPPILPKAIPDGWFYKEMVNYHRMISLIDGALAPDEKTVDPKLAEAAATKIQNECSANPMKSLIVDHTLFSRLMVPALSRVTTRTAKTQAGVDLAGVACALERYRMQKGSYPATLDELKPFTAGLKLQDVIQGKPLHYRLENTNSYALYSVGWNMTDDSGFLGEKQKGSSELIDGDWVWRPIASVPAPKKPGI